jgi:hypothetical protein
MASQIGTPKGMSRADLDMQAADAFAMGPRFKYYASLLDN